MSDYDYKPLNKRSREIRLLILDGPAKAAEVEAGPASGELTTLDDAGATLEDAPLRCRMIVTSLAYYSNKFENDSLKHKTALPTFVWGVNNSQKFVRRVLSGGPAEYHALSWVWNNPTRVCDIVIDDHHVKISQNLLEALTSIYTKTNIRVVWCDALCINQNDDVEKSWQVREMATVYRRASSVVSWLGPINRHTKAAFDALQGLQSVEVARQDTVRSLMKSRDTIVSVYDKAVGELMHNLKQWVAVLHLADNPYWTRKWIFQELACARERLFLWGDRTMLDVDTTLTILMNKLPRTTPHARDFQMRACVPVIRTIWDLHYREIPTLGMVYDNSHILPLLLTLLQRLNMLDTSDPRDQMFALFSIAHDREKLDLDPDYSKPVEVILRETASAILRRGQLELLLDAGRSEPKVMLPSWAPSWSRTIAAKLDPKLYHLFEPFEKAAHLKINGDELSIDASVVDDVSSVGLPYGIRPSEYEPGSATATVDSSPPFGSWLKSIESNVWDHEMYTKGKTGDDVQVQRNITVQLLSAGTINSAGFRRMATQPSTKIITDLYTLMSNADGLEEFAFNLRSAARTPETTIALDYFSAVWRILATGYVPVPMKTESGYSCLGFDQEYFAGDRIIIIPGVGVPLIIRRNKADGGNSPHKEVYHLVGVAYVHGIMDGEFFARKPAPVRQKITLI